MHVQPLPTLDPRLSLRPPTFLPRALANLAAKRGLAAALADAAGYDTLGDALAAILDHAAQSQPAVRAQCLIPDRRKVRAA